MNYKCNIKNQKIILERKVALYSGDGNNGSWMHGYFGLMEVVSAIIYGPRLQFFVVAPLYVEEKH